ncbi:MAG: VOC family protein [Solirubrobacteraceae bacterium]|nr:VOC family protein [Solirubrobacteraceae bacterium]
MTVHFAHAGLIARDPDRLAAFYVEVLGGVSEVRRLHMSGAWLDRATGIDGAEASGLHVRLPGHGADGPTIEILSYAGASGPHQASAVNDLGLGHLAFEVHDVDAVGRDIVRAGGTMVGEPATTEIVGRGTLRVVFARDPEGNIIELLSWG